MIVRSVNKGDAGLAEGWPKDCRSEGNRTQSVNFGGQGLNEYFAGAATDFPFAKRGGFAWVRPMLFPSDNIAALATPVGTAAIALLRASGAKVRELLTKIFGAVPTARMAMHADYRDSDGILLDDVVYTYFAGPNSYTGEDSMEISCHGNPYIAQRILEDLFRRGCRGAEAGEFTKRAFLNGRLDLSQAEAVMDLIHARSERALTAANQQLRGSLGRHLEGLIARLIKILAQIEAYIDFPEEDLPPENKNAIRAELEALCGEVRRLIATNHYSGILRDGLKTVIVGAPNAGKSSLLNRLVGRERALVSPEPGTTRDYLEERILLGPHLLRLIDTAGLNSKPTSLEGRGIQKTIEQVGAADFFLWVIDSTLPLPILPEAVAKMMTFSNTVAILNKSDLPEAQAEIGGIGFQCVKMSALTGDGVGALGDTVIEMTDSFRAVIGVEVIAINARHTQAVGHALASIITARDSLEAGNSIELMASDLRVALEAFGEVSGRIDHEKILDELFSSFCIGK